MSNWISDIQWDTSRNPPAPYRVYLVDGPNYRAGDRTYVPPAEPHPSNTSDQRLLQWAAQMKAAKPGASFNHLSADSTSWDSKTGRWKQSFDPTGIASVAAGALIGGPATVNAFGFGGPTATTAAPTGAGTTAGATGAYLAPAASPSVFGAAAPAAGLAYPSAAGLTNTAAIGSTAGPAALASQGASAGIPLAGGSSVSQLLNGLKDKFTGRDGGENIAGLAALLPLLMSRGGGNSPFGNEDELAEEIRKSLAMQRGRVEQAQPVYDTLVRMSMGMSPASYRDGGTRGTDYPYVAPRFGGR